MVRRDEKKLQTTTNSIVNLTLAKTVHRRKDGTYVTPRTEENAFLEMKIRELREVALLLRGAPGALAHIQYLKFEGRP
jgi:hypothetical protein